jgi:hypothetical protein
VAAKPPLSSAQQPPGALSVLTVIACLATGCVCFALGCACAPTKIVEPDQLAAYMARVVNAEGHDERRMQLRRVMHRSGRRTMRLDGGLPAKVHRMRTYKRATRS